jgi:PhoPQ-activated pathogenicity-related protein
MPNRAKSFIHSGVLVIGMLSAPPDIGEMTVLDRYVAAPDPSYRYELIATIPGDGYAAQVLEMTPQRWRDETEVNRPLWKHWLTVIEPDQVATGTLSCHLTPSCSRKRSSVETSPTTTWSPDPARWS